MSLNNKGVVARILGSRSKRLSSTTDQEVLTWQFSQAERKRVAILVDRNNRGTISRDEMDQLQMFVSLGTLLDILHAKARHSLKSNRSQKAA